MLRNTALCAIVALAFLWPEIAAVNPPPGPSPPPMPPGGSFPPGSLPPGGSFPPGSLPPGGSFPPGSLPPGGSFPPGSLPPGGSFPPGSLQPGAPAAPAPPAGQCSTACGTNLTSQYLVQTNATHRIITTNGIPYHSYYVHFPAGHVANPNSVCVNYRRMTIPLKPKLSKSFTILPLGPCGILITGGFLYNHLDGPTTSDNDLAIYREVSMDTCEGHPDQGCRYHYHKNPQTCVKNYTECMLLGYLADGFPVYSYCSVNGKNLSSCYSQYENNNTGMDTSDYFYNSTKLAAKDCELDEANGYCFDNASTLGIATSSTCNYGYVLTETYPFVVPSYAGETFFDMETLTSFPATSGPTTSKPTTAKPTTAKPTTAKPTTAKPTTAKPTTAKPTTAKPTTAKPTTAKPTTAKPTTAKPTTAKPTTAKPTTAKPTTAKPN